MNVRFKRSETQSRVVVCAQSVPVLSFHCCQCWKSCLTQNGKNTDKAMSESSRYAVAVLSEKAALW